MTKILLAGPGTGKTTKIKEIIKSYPESSKILVLSFTNATINDLLDNFSKENINITNEDCMTLHKFALKINHLKGIHILNLKEEEYLMDYANKLSMGFDEICRILDCITFERMIIECSNFVSNNKVYAEQKIGNLDILIVDEYQDFNEVERNLINAVSKFSKDTIILGDDDQCIYDFKNADSDGIIEIFNKKESEKIFHENICYRCPDILVSLCENFIKKNKNRIDKDWNLSKKQGVFTYKQLLEQEKTIQYVIKKILEIKKNDKEGSILILSPVRFVVQDLLPNFEKNKIDFVDWFSKKIDQKDLNMIWELRAFFGKHKLLNVLFLVKDLPKNSNYIKRIIRETNKYFLGNFDENEVSDIILGMKILDKKLTGYIKTEPDFETFFKENTQYDAFYKYIKSNILQDLQTKLEKLDSYLADKLEFDKLKVNVMSIHKSKGLQADYVFVMGLVNGILPNKSKGVASMEAQRRLLFVAMSRAQKGLHLVSTVEWEGRFVNKVNKSEFIYNYQKKKWEASASLFITELDIPNAKKYLNLKRQNLVP